MSGSLRFFPDIAWENLALQEAEDRRREANVVRSQVTPQMAQRAADLSFAYPSMPGGVVGGLTQMGIDALTPEANSIAARNDQLEAAGFEAPPEKGGFFDAGVGRAFKSMTRGAFTFFQSLYDEGVKGTTALLYGLGQGKPFSEALRGAYGYSPGAIAASQLLKGNDVDLGEGFFPGGQVAQVAESEFQRRGTKLAGTDLAITPGRVVASTITQPGTKPFNLFSGTLDFGANIFLDPADKLGLFIGDLRKSNKFLAGGLVDGRRPTMLGRTVDDWLGTRHGDRVAQHIADTDDYLTLHNLFRKNATESNVDAAFISQLQKTTDKDGIKNLLSTIAKGGAGGHGQLRELPVGQTIGGRVFGARSAPAGVAAALLRGIGVDDTNITVNGLRSVVQRQHAKSTLLGRLGAEVGVRALRVEDVSGSVDDFGQHLQAAGFAPERVSHYMSQMAELESGGLETAAQMFGIVKASMREFGEQLVEEGIAEPVARAFTQLHDTVSDYRKFWIDQTGNPQFFPGSQYKVLVNGQLQALPSAQLFSEFMDHAIPLADIRKIRQALHRKTWAKAGFTDLAQKRVKREGVSFNIEKMEGWDDLGPGVIGGLINTAVQDFWKPLVLLRIAWPVRVIAEEQVRMLAAGLDTAYNHPIHSMMLAMNRGYRGSYLGTDVKGNSIEEAYEFATAMSRRGMEFGREAGRALYTDEWLKVAQDSPDYWKGLAVELQQLSDDPIAQRIARDIVEATDATEGAADLESVLRAIKDDFWSGEMSSLRATLAADGKRWDLVNVREAADGYIDSVYGRVVHKTGGEVVYADTLRGDWHDLYGNKLERIGEGRYRNTNTLAEIELPNPPRSGRLSVKQMPDELERIHRNMLETTETWTAKAPEDIAMEMDLFDFDDLSQTLDQVERLQNSLRALNPEAYGNMADQWGPGSNPRVFREWIRDNFDDIAENPNPKRVKELQKQLKTMRGVTNEMLDLARKEADPSGRMNLRALELMELSGNRAALETRFAGYVPSPGMPTLDELADKDGWTIPEIRAALAGNQESFGRHEVRRAPDHVPTTGTHIWTEPVSPGVETHWIANDGWTTGYITVQKDGGKVVNIEMFSVANGPKRIPQGQAGAIPGESRDAMRLIRHVVEEGGEGTEDLANLAFNGVSMRDWLGSAGLDMENMTLLEAVDALRKQHGAAWSGRTTGPLGELPSITLSGDGAAQVGAALLRTATRGPGDPKGVQAWQAGGQFYQALRQGDLDLMRAIAAGKIGDETLSFHGALDETDKVKRVDLSAHRLQELYGDRMDILPQYTKVAKKAEGGKVNSAVDHMFDLLMSRPTNTLSRSPAFKQFYWRRIAEMMPYMDDATKAAALKAAREAGVGRGDLRSMVKAAFKTEDITQVKLEEMAEDFIKGRFAEGTGDLASLDDVDEIAKAFALQETKRLLYDLSKKTNFFDITRNIFPFGEAWYEIITTWARLIGENPHLIRRMQQGIQGARNTGFFYPDPSTGEEVFAMPHYDALANLFDAGAPEREDVEGEQFARPVFTGRVEGLNLILNNFLPGVGPVVQLPAASLGQDFLNQPEFRWARDFLFPFGYPDAETPTGIFDSLMPAWFQKALVGFGRPSADNERLYNNTVIDVLRAMEINGEIPSNLEPAQRATLMEEARSRARRLYQIRSISQFIGPTGAQVRWDVDVDPMGEAFAYQVLATEFREMIQTNRGDRLQAFLDFVNRFGFDPASIATAKTEQVRPGTVTEYGLDFKQQNPELFRDKPLTAYYAAPDPPDAEFNYNAYLAQLEEGDRVGLTPDQWLTERNRLLGSLAYERVRRNAAAAGNLNDRNIQAYLRFYRFSLMEEYPGYGFDNVGVPVAADRWQFIEEFQRWRDDEQLAQTQTGQGLVRYLEERERALALASSQYGVSERGFSDAKATTPLRIYLLTIGENLSRQYPDFATVFQRHFQWEVEEPEPIAPDQLLGVDFSFGGGTEA